MRYAIWHHQYNFKKVKNTHIRVLFFVELQALACNFTKSKTLAWVFFTFVKLYKWYRITESISCKQQQSYWLQFYTFFLNLSITLKY